MVIREHGAEATRPQRAVRVPERDHALEPCEQLVHDVVLARVIVGLVVGPQHRLPVVRVARAPHADLGAVPQHGSTDVGHLQEDRETQTLVVLGAGFTRSVRRHVLRAVLLVVSAVGIQRHAHGTIRVMAVEQVLHDVRRLARVPPAHDRQPAIELPRRDPLRPVEHPRHDRGRELVVHDGVERVALEPGRRGLPDLARDVGVRIDRLHERSPLAPERDRYLVRYIQAPTVDAIGGIAVTVGVEPAPREREQVLAQRCTRDAVGVVLPELRQRAMVEPAFVLEWFPRPDLEPVRIGTRGPALTHIAERRVTRADVIEHAIQHDPESGALEFAEHIQELAIVGIERPGRGVEQILGRLGLAIRGAHAVAFVDVQVVRGVVLVRALGLEHGQQVERVHAQGLEVGDRFDQPAEVPPALPVPDLIAIEGPVVGRLPLRTRGPWAPPLDQALPGRCPRAPPEAIDQDLVPDRMLRPLGRREPCDLGRVQPIHMSRGQRKARRG